MRHLLIGLIALVIFLMLVLYASAKMWGAEPQAHAARDAPITQPAKLSPRRALVFDTLYSGRTRVNPVQKQLIREGYGVAGKLPILGADGRLEGVITADDIVLSLGQRIHALAEAVQRELRNEALPPDSGSSVFGKE